MPALDKVIQTLSAQLRGFSATARLLIGALMVVLALSLVLVAMLTGRAEMVPLGLGGAANAEARTRAVNYLQNHRIQWEEGSDDVLVPADQRHVVLAQLTERELITPEQIDFGSVLSQDSPFTDRATRKARYLIAKMNEVSRMINELNGIDRASVVIDQPERTGIGSARIDPTASVIVQVQGGPLGQVQADAIARIVAGSHAALKIENVTVVDARSGRAMSVRTDDALSANRYLDTKRQAEKHAKRTIEQALSVIPGVVVAVNAQVDATEVVREERSYDEPKVGVAREDSRERTSTNRTGGGEPGVRPNTGVRIQGGSGRESNMSDIQSKSRMVNAFGNSESLTKDPRGFALRINATVLVPKSHFVRLFHDRSGAASTDDGAPPADPAPAELQAVVDVEIEAIKRLVEPLVDTSAFVGALPSTVVVSMFTDASMMRGGLGGGGGGGGGSGLGSIAGVVPERVIRSVGLGTLALVSLALMFMMVRKASREEEMPTAEELVGIPPTLAEADADVVGEAEETVAAMEGLEIDEGAVRRQQMIDQINDLAAESSDEAASLLRKWIKVDD